MPLYHPLILRRQFLISLWLFIIHSCYGDSLSFSYDSLSCNGDSLFFPYGSLSYIHIVATVIFSPWPFIICMSLLHSLISFFLISFHHSLCIFHFSMYLSFHNVSLPFLTILVSFSSFFIILFLSFLYCMHLFIPLCILQFRYFSSSFPMSIFQYIMSFSMPPL
jgi:hypothetical protein